MRKIFEGAKKIFKGWYEKKVSMICVGTGSALVMGGISQNWWMSFAVSIVNENLHTNFPIPDAVSVDYFVIYPGILLMVFGALYHLLTREKTKKHNILKIMHSSIESVSYSNIDKDLSDYNIEELKISQSEELKSIDKQNLHHALREQEKVVTKILNRIDGSSDMEFAYLGLAHVPLVFLFGYQMADKSNGIFFEWNQNKTIWEEIKNKRGRFPQLFVERTDLIEEKSVATDVVIKIGITTPITNADLAGLHLEGVNSYYMHLEPPRRNVVVSLEQLQEYKKEFRELLDEINRSFPNLKKIHLFYSGQPSLAYHLGSAISPRMDAEVLVYNHVRQATPKYKWAINLKKAGQPVDIHIIEEGVQANV